jgi:hypothetical protein
MGLALSSKNLLRVVSAVCPRLLPRQRQRLPLPQLEVQRQRHQRQAAAQWQRRS